MSEALIRQSIHDVLKAVADIGKVHNYDRYATDDAAYINLFKDTRSARILGWEISRAGVQAEKISVIEEEASHTFIIRGYMSVNDAKQSELLFNAKIETVRAAFRGNNTLGNLCLDAGPVSAPVIDIRTFGGVLCHYAELRLPVTELLV